MRLPTISVVTPSFNQQKYLEKTLLSVLSQSYPATEYFVMDGGSTDGSLEIINKYQDQITGWVSAADSGQADAINQGFARCTGEIFAWINSDDFYLKGAFQKAAEFFSDHPDVDLVYGDVISVDEDETIINVMRFSSYDRDDLLTFHIISQPGVFFRRSAWERAGGLDLSYKLMLDHELWIRMMKTGKMAYLPIPLAAARFHDEAKNIAQAADFGKEAFRILNKYKRDGKKPSERQLMGGAFLVDAFYLSNAGHPAEALNQYWQAFKLDPSRTLRDWRRIALTILMKINPALAQKLYLKQVQQRMNSLKGFQSLLDSSTDGGE